MFVCLLAVLPFPDFPIPPSRRKRSHRVSAPSHLQEDSLLFISYFLSSASFCSKPHDSSADMAQALGLRCPLLSPGPWSKPHVNLSWFQDPRPVTVDNCSRASVPRAHFPPTCHPCAKPHLARPRTSPFRWAFHSGAFWNTFLPPHLPPRLGALCNISIKLQSSQASLRPAGLPPCFPVSNTRAGTRHDQRPPVMAMYRVTCGTGRNMDFWVPLWEE